MKNFLWNQGETAKGKAKVAWANICKPKDQGGLGLKPLEQWNRTLLIKHLWNIATMKETLWVKWINVEKLKGKSVWEVTQDSTSSIGWKNILNLREKVRKHVFYKLGDGKSVSAWFDKWCSEGPLCEFISIREIYNARLSIECTVEELVVDNNWGWPMDWNVKFSRLNNVHVPILNNRCKDKTMWVSNLEKKTEYATKVVWKDMRSYGRTVVWKDLVWFPQNIPRHSFVIWLAVQERLMTQDRLAAWNQDDEMRCVFL